MLGTNVRGAAFNSSTNASIILMFALVAGLATTGCGDVDTTPEGVTEAPASNTPDELEVQTAALTAAGTCTEDSVFDYDRFGECLSGAMASCIESQWWAVDDPDSEDTFGVNIACIADNAADSDELTCDDGADNDGDGLIDCQDPDCNTLSCDDGNACTTGGTCSGDVCVGTTPVDDEEPCDDGAFCTVDDMCGAGVCNGTPMVCEDDDVCDGTDWCNELTDSCDDAPDLECDDGDVCNGAESCDSVIGCEAGDVLECDDGDACNGAESCDSVIGCEAGDVLECDDGDVCNGSESCDSVIGCEAGDVLECDDSDVCTGTESCDPDAGCMPGVPLVCDDSDVCNGEESCDSESGCMAGTPLVCNDELFCNGEESCDSELGCQDEADPDCSEGDTECGTGFCDVVTDLCDADLDDEACTAGPCEVGMCTEEGCVTEAIEGCCEHGEPGDDAMCDAWVPDGSFSVCSPPAGESPFPGDCTYFPLDTDPENCSDGVDNDEDGATDCNDPDCFAADACSSFVQIWFDSDEDCPGTYLTLAYECEFGTEGCSEGWNQVRNTGFVSACEDCSIIVASLHLPDNIVGEPWFDTHDGVIVTTGTDDPCTGDPSTCDTSGVTWMNGLCTPAVYQIGAELCGISSIVPGHGYDPLCDGPPGVE
jgi:hypothetical protein